MPQTRSSFGSNTAYAKGKRRIRYWADKHDGRGYRRCSEIVKGTKRDADKVLAMRQIEHGKDKPTPTLEQCYELYYKPWLELRYNNDSISYSTYRNRKSSWNAQLKPALGDMLVTDIKPPIVQEWAMTLPSGSARANVGLLQAIFERAAFNDIDVPNIRVRYEYPKHKKTKASTGSYTLDELRQIWVALYNTDIEVPFLLQAFGSCRVGESLGVKVEEVEYDGTNQCAVIEIKRQVLHAGGTSQDGELKTPQSHRYIVLCGKAGERIRDIATKRTKAGFEWLCGQSDPLPQRTYHTHFKTLVASAGLTAYPPTTLRPSWQTIAKYTLNIQPTIIECLMGHLAAGVTGTNYDRPRKNDYVRSVVQAYKIHKFDTDWEIWDN